MKKISLILLFLPALIFSQNEQKIHKAVEFYKQKEYEKAKEGFEDLMDDDIKVDSFYYYAGMNYMALKEYEEASEVFEKAVELNPKSSHYYLMLGNSYGLDAQNSSIFSQFSLAKKCKNSYLKAVELDPENIGARVALASYYYQAPGIAGGDTEEAIAQANFIIKKDEKRGRILLADIYVSEDENEKAEKEFKTLEKNFGDDSTFYNMYNSYGYFLLKQNRIKEALEKFKRQVALAPGNANAYDSLGDGFLAAGDNKSAAEAFSKALKIDPNNSASKKKLKELQAN